MSHRNESVQNDTKARSVKGTDTNAELSLVLDSDGDKTFLWLIKHFSIHKTSKHSFKKMTIVEEPLTHYP